jgi:hypothetical protein
MIFQDVAWIEIKSLWQRIVPMLRCWRVLVPLVMESGYESVASQLEKLLMMPETIEPPSLTRDWACWPNHTWRCYRRSRKTGVIKQWGCSFFCRSVLCIFWRMNDVMSELSVPWNACTLNYKLNLGLLQCWTINWTFVFCNATGTGRCGPLTLKKL